MRKYASDEAVVMWFNQTYGTHLRAPIVELMSISNSSVLLDAPNGLQSTQEVELFAQFVLSVLWPRFRLQSSRSATWVPLASALARRREWARRARPAR
jgi:hypothetical protein